MLDWITDRLKEIATAIGAFLAGFFAGKLKEQKKQSDKKLGAMRDAKAIQDRIDRDPAYREHVRDEYR